MNFNKPDLIIGTIEYFLGCEIENVKYYYSYVNGFWFVSAIVDSRNGKKVLKKARVLTRHTFPKLEEDGIFLYHYIHLDSTGPYQMLDKNLNLKGTYNTCDFDVRNHKFFGCNKI